MRPRLYASEFVYQYSNIAIQCFVCKKYINKYLKPASKLDENVHYCSLICFHKAQSLEGIKE